MPVLFDVQPSLEEAFGTPPPIDQFLKRSFPAEVIRKHYDTLHSAVCLQGIVNRSTPQLYIRYITHLDDFWKETMESEEFIDPASWTRVTDLSDLLSMFHQSINGLVVWDERVPATSLLASSIAGIENLIAVRRDESIESIYTMLLEELKLPVVHDLSNGGATPLFTGEKSGSAKCDAYHWFIKNYVKTGKTNPNLLGYYIDADWLKYPSVSWLCNHTLTNHDYIISHKGILFDLHVCDDEQPRDDPDQPLGSDYRTLCSLLNACNEQMDDDALIHVAGYVPWRFKYTDCNEGGHHAGGKNDPVWTEWKCTEVLSAYNAWLDADALEYAALCNASFFQHQHLKDVYPQEPVSRRLSIRIQGDSVEPKNYVSWYVGDYDAAAWLWWNLPRLWEDQRRGEFPLSWAFNPVLAKRFAFGLHWARTHATANDIFVAGDSGAGYVNPRNLSAPRPHSDYPSGINRWEDHCKQWFYQWDLDTVGFIIDGHTDTMLAEGFDAYSRFSPGGFVFHRHENKGGLHQGIPWMRYNGDLPMGEDQSIEDAWLEELLPKMKEGGPHFHIYRAVLQSPSFYARVSQRLIAESPHPVEIVDIPLILQLWK